MSFRGAAASPLHQEELQTPVYRQFSGRQRYQRSARHSQEYRQPPLLPPKAGAPYLYECLDNEYRWRYIRIVFPTLPQEPQGYSSFSDDGGGASLTGWNDWPSSLSNESIFPFLLDSPSHELPPEFCNFIKRYYKASCAIVNKAVDGSVRIIGSGGLISNTMVATARHVFEEIRVPNNLYVRFYHYEVTQIDRNNLNVKEHYLDIPVIRTENASQGFDFGYLYLPLLSPALREKYMQPISVDQGSRLSPNLNDGTYAIFHFAGGKYHQISLGAIYSPSAGANLQNNMQIQAGSGASGAIVIRKIFDRIKTAGISIYRIIGNGNVERRVVPFSENPWFIDRISAPYRNEFRVSTPRRQGQNGPEFAVYDPEIDRPPAPNYPAYEHPPFFEHQSNHHIIPIRDLLYLWDYFFIIEEKMEYRIREELKRNKVFSQKLSSVLKNLKKEYKEGESDVWRNFHGLPTLEEKLGKLKKSFVQNCSKEEDRLTKFWIQSEFEEKFHKFHTLIEDLCYPLIIRERCQRVQNRQTKIVSGFNPDVVRMADSRRKFAWSFWNLFKGWELKYRQDDPKYDGVDKSEKNMPKNFNEELWLAVKNLHAVIQKLRATESPVPAIEEEIFQSLSAVKSSWDRTGHKDAIYGYKRNDWVRVGWKDGHELYRLKLPDEY
ncbi:MAG: hypothetical protein K0S63_1155, partial [Gammaproteobacteria bacterium]|nr:hypothetical protein [Gammaproteobacteria bacterium]